MKEIVKISSFVLIIIGTLGLLAVEFLFKDSVTTGYTLLFAVLNLVGLVVLTFTLRGNKAK